MVTPRGEVTATICGTERSLRMCHRAIAHVEELLGKPWYQINFNSLGVREIGVIAYAALRVCDKRISLDDVYDWMDEEGGQEDVASAVGDAMKAFAAGADKKKEPPGKAKR
jgi:hypothetical protein